MYDFSLSALTFIFSSIFSFKSSFLGRKGGFLHNYAMMEASTGSNNNPGSQSASQLSAEATPIKVTPPTPSRSKSLKVMKNSGALKKFKENNSGSMEGPSNTINISLPSPAGNANVKSKKSTGNKKWDKYR